MKQFSEATRVQIPAMVHLTRIGYSYFGKLNEDMNLIFLILFNSYSLFYSLNFY